MNQLEEIVASIILRLRRGESPQNLIQEIKEVKVEGPLREGILESVVRQLTNGLDERSLFGRLVQLDREGLERIKASSEEFLSFEPFKGVNRVKILEFWSEVLDKVLANLQEAESGE